jgi:long-subunit acyl-CoA synthetase (AMP-forming)
VANICVYASIDETNPIAIIVPVEPALKKLADTIGVEGHGIGDLVHNERLQAAVLKDMQAVGKRAGLASMEIISGVILADEEWTPQNVSRRTSFGNISNGGTELDDCDFKIESASVVREVQRRYQEGLSSKG